MSWMKGTGPVKDVSAVGVSRGLSEDWYSEDSTHKDNRKEIKKGSFWDIIDNPLYEVAAGAAGYDWDEWVKDAKGKVGTGPDDGTVRVRAIVKAGTNPTTKSVRSGRNSMREVTTLGTPAEYEWMTVDEAKAQGLDYEGVKTTRWRNKETGEIINDLADARDEFKGLNNPLWTKARGIKYNKLKEKISEDWEEIHDWGVHDIDVAENLDEFSGWLSEIVNVNDHLHPIIREGPKGEHYGIEGDIWEHYGLDKEPEPPKELDWDSAEKGMQLATAVRSEVTYSTPDGITPVNLHGD